MLRNTTNSFGAVTKCFHWLLFILLAAQFTLGTLYALAPEGSPQQTQFILWHKSNGLTILVFALFFMMWNFFSVHPQPANTDPNWKRKIAKIVQHSIMFLIMLMPILGYGLSCSGGHLVSYFNWFTLPCLLEKNDFLHPILETLHVSLGFLLFGLIMLHILAALHHHFILKDNVLKRMLPGCSKSKP